MRLPGFGSFHCPEWLLRFVPARFILNACCNGGNSATQALANILEPGWVAGYWEPRSEDPPMCQHCGLQPNPEFVHAGQLWNDHR